MVTSLYVTPGASRDPAGSAFDTEANPAIDSHGEHGL